MPLPVIVVEPMDSVTVQVPAAGKPLKATLPVANAHVGCVTAPIVITVGKARTVLVIPVLVAVQPEALVTITSTTCKFVKALVV